MGPLEDKRKIRFGLKSFLIVTTLACLLIGGVAQPLFKARKHRQLLAQLEQLGANISSQGTLIRDPTVGQQILKLFSNEYDRDYLYKIDFRGTSIVDKDLELLQQLPYLYRLDLSGTKVTDAGVDWIVACPTIYELDLSNTQVTNAGALKLKSLQSLAWLNTLGTAVNYDALSVLDDQLPWANFAEQRAIAEIEAYGAQANGTRRFFEISDPPGPEYPGLFVPQGGEELTGGYLLLGTNRKLKLGRAQISHLGHLDSLVHLNIHDVVIAPDSFADVPAIPNLTEIEIYHTDVTDAELEDLARQTQVITFKLWGSKQVTDAGVSELAKLPNLKKLEIGGCPEVTSKSIDYLRQQLPDCKVTYSPLRRRSETQTQSGGNL